MRVDFRTMEGQNVPKFAVWRSAMIEDVRRGTFQTVGDRLVCHECGRDFIQLGTHAWWSHGLTARAYREKWGVYGPLVARELSGRLAEIASSNGGTERIRATPRPPVSEATQRKGSEAFARLSRYGTRPGYRGLHATAHRLILCWKAGESMDEELAALEVLVNRRAKKQE
jgi:hypothetical protein